MDEITFENYSLCKYPQEVKKLERASRLRTGKIAFILQWCERAEKVLSARHFLILFELKP